LLFSKWSPNAMTHNLHVVALGTLATRNEILFRDRLRSDPPTAAEYAQLKQRLATKVFADPHGYSRAKTDFVVAVVNEERARIGLPESNIWATLGSKRRAGWIVGERRLPPGAPVSDGELHFD
jgi:GrpB protein